MIYISAGHNKPGKATKGDPGAVSNGLQEADLTIMQRNLTGAALRELAIPFQTDTDTETLSQYIARVAKQSDSSDVCLEYHFDAATPAATGCTAIVADKASKVAKDLATELAKVTASVLGLRNRGVITEAQSHRGKLGFMRLPGATVILELGFITNLADIEKWREKRGELARVHAKILQKFDQVKV